MWYYSYSNLTIDDTIFEPEDFDYFVYDSTVSLSFAACSASKPNHNTYFDNGQAHYNAILNTSFEGASGKIYFNPLTGTRDTDSVQFSIFNAVEDGKSNEETSDIINFSFIETNIYQNGNWTSLKPHIFNDGTSTVPLWSSNSNCRYELCWNPCKGCLFGDVSINYSSFSYFSFMDIHTQRLTCAKGISTNLFKFDLL